MLTQRCSVCGKFRAEDDLIPMRPERGWFDDREYSDVICYPCVARITGADPRIDHTFTIRQIVEQLL